MPICDAARNIDSGLAARFCHDATPRRAYYVARRCGAGWRVRVLACSPRGLLGLDHLLSVPELDQLGVSRNDFSTLLAHHIRQHGPIRTARVSSAKSSTQYRYWGAVRYQIRLTADGSPTNCALERASSDRRSQRLVERDCDNLCESEDRIRCQTIGRLSESECRCVLLALGYAAEVATHDARRDTTAPAPMEEDGIDCSVAAFPKSYRDLDVA